MFGLGPLEIGVIVVIALLVLGPKKLPEMASKLGAGIREFRNATDSFKSTMDGEIHKQEPPRAPKKPAAAAPDAAGEAAKAIDDGRDEVVASTVPVEAPEPVKTPAPEPSAEAPAAAMEAAADALEAAAKADEAEPAKKAEPSA